MHSQKLQQNEMLVAEFENLLKNTPPTGRQKEQIVQDFLEENSELIPAIARLNHQVHFDMVISKYALCPEYITDYIWMTKASDRWRVVLVELESPDKPIFTNNMDEVRPSAQFNAAMDQVRSWKTFISDNREEVIRRLWPFFKPDNMRDNPIEFYYELIIGRSSNKNATQNRRKYINMLEKESEIHIMSYDTIIDAYKNDRLIRKDILRQAGTRFEFKRIHTDTRMFSFIGPDTINLSGTDIEHLRREGYEIDAWVNGTLLSTSSDGKLTHRTYLERLPDTGLINVVLKRGLNKL